MRRIANQLADLFARHGHAAEADATVTGRTRTAYRFPLVVRSTPLVLVDGDLDNDTIDDGSVLRLYLAATDVGAKALFVHSGTVPASAREYLGDRVLLWSKDDIVHALGLTAWNAALGLPMPALPLVGAAIEGQLPAPVAVNEIPPPLESEPATTAPAAPTVEPAVPALLPDLPPAAEAPEASPERQAENHREDPTPVLATPENQIPTDLFIDLDALADPEVVDLETGDVVDVTSLPTSQEDELNTAEPLAMRSPAPAPAASLAPDSLTLPDAFSEHSDVPTGGDDPVASAASGAPDAPSDAGAATEAPLFELPPAFRPEPPGALPVPEGSRGLLPARVTLEEAKSAVAGRLFGIEEWELILQPVHLFDYAIDLLREGSLNVDTERGRIQVNGTDRGVLAIDPGSCDPPHRVLATEDLVVMDKVLRVNPERAEQVARAWATELHGKTIDMPMSGADDDYDLTERRTISPTSTQVTLQPLGVWHRPFWRLWGSNGHVDLDAVEGGVLDEEIKTPDPDFLMVD